jgi:hypothetical protein
MRYAFWYIFFGKYLLKSFAYFLEVLRVELRALHLLDRHTTTNPFPYFVIDFFFFFFAVEFWCSLCVWILQMC